MLAANRVALESFHVLVGPNASGKTTFLDALQFLADLLEAGVEEAVASRAPSFLDLCFDSEKPISIAVEVNATEPVAHASKREKSETTSRLRYEVQVGIHPDDGLRVLRENLFILPQGEYEIQPSLFGFGWGSEVIHDKTPSAWRKVVSKTAEGKDYFRDERTEWNNVFRFGLDRAALGSIPEDPNRFPLSISTRNLLREGIRTLVLDARRMRDPAPPGMKARMALDGSNLPYVARALKARDKVLFDQWVSHLSTAIEGLESVGVHERPEDKYLVLQAQFLGMHTEPVPSWMLSDGTLRLMALTLLSYAALPEVPEIYLIEEPENGLHPLAVQGAFEVLGDPPQNMQIFCATHSPVFLAHVQLDEALVFRRSPEGFAIVRHGGEVPELEKWSGQHNLSDLLATGVLS